MDRGAANDDPAPQAWERVDRHLQSKFVCVIVQITKVDATGEIKFGAAPIGGGGELTTVDGPSPLPYKLATTWP